METTKGLAYEREQFDFAIEELRDFDMERPHYLWSLLAVISSFDLAPHAERVRELWALARKSGALAEPDVRTLMADIPEPEIAREGR